MASRKIQHIKFSGISAVVPKDIVYIQDYVYMTDIEKKKFIENVGIHEKRQVQTGTTSGDLCAIAATQLINEKKIDRNEIDALVFVSQTRDHIFPCTSTIIQHKLGLGKHCLSFDVPLGCSGYVYGISIIATLMESGTIKKGLLLCGDVCSQTVSIKDKTISPMLGDAGTATLLEYEKDFAPIYCTMHSDGSGANDLIMHGGGFRTPWDTHLIEEKTCFDGIQRKGYHAYINGLKVFEFAIREVAIDIENIIKFANINKKDVDYFVLHQANMMINKTVQKQLKIEQEKFINSMYHYGNTGAASIPLSIVSQMKNILNRKKNKLLLSGFGVGLSWASMLIDIPEIETFDLIEY